MGLSVDIVKTFGDFTLAVAFETGEEIFAVLGESGCGKSLTLKCIAGIEKPDSGRICLNDRVLYDSQKGINLPPPGASGGLPLPAVRPFSQYDRGPKHRGGSIQG